MQESRSWFDEVRRFTEKLVSIASISPDFEGENLCAKVIKKCLQENGGNIALFDWKTVDKRLNVIAFVQGEHPDNDGKTVILLSHYDTVGVDEFHTLDLVNREKVAFSPNELRAAIQKRSTERQSVPSAVYQDWRAKWQRNGKPEWVWMFGRGSFDMKSGVAIHMAVLRRLAQERDQLAGNVLFLACPDEENESEGIRSAVPKLIDFRQQRKLRYSGVINADYCAPRSDNERVRYIYNGSVGKLLPAFYILGDPTHVGEPFRGVDAGQIAAEIVQHFNLNTDLSDSWEHEGKSEVAVPPMTLHVRDLKKGYNVQTASEAFVYINWLTYTLSPQKAMEILLREVNKALATVLTKRKMAYARFNGTEPTPSPQEATVISFANLCWQIRKNNNWGNPPNDPRDDPFHIWLGNVARQVRKNLALNLDYAPDAREVSRLIVLELIREAQLSGPAVVIFFAPPYYPHILPQNNELTQSLAFILAQLTSDADTPLKLKWLEAANGDTVEMQLRGFYPYISDLSYMRLDRSVKSDIDALIENMPLFRRGYWLDFSAAQELDCTVVNIGPYGKDAHGLYERVHMPYSFEVVPQMIYETVKQVLKGGKE